VVAGSAIGLAAGARIPPSARGLIFGGLGLVTLVIGTKMATSTGNELILLAAILAGGLVGHALGLERRLEALGQQLQRRFAREEGSRFSEGFVTASLVFCVGPMTVQGSIEDGLRGDYTLLAIKSMLDFFASIGFAAALGWGVMASVATVVVVQGALTLGASLLAGLLTPDLVREMTAAGGTLVLGIGLRLLDLKRLPVADFLPALAAAPAIAASLPSLRGAFATLFP
jgi:uncharacterized protein